jgi:hypothetical protein
MLEGRNESLLTTASITCWVTAGSSIKNQKELQSLGCVIYIINTRIFSQTQSSCQCQIMV